MSFIDLIKALLIPPKYQNNPGEYDIRDEQLDDLGKILYLMSKTGQETNWAPLVYVKFDIAEKYTEANLRETLKTVWRDYVLNQGHASFVDGEKYGVMITLSGRFFAKMVPDFEYFACRFASRFRPLFISDNLNFRSKDDNYKCILLIERVRNNAFHCIDKVIERDKEFFLNDDGDYDFSWLYKKKSPYHWLYKGENTSVGKPHPYRVLDSHIGYLQHYVKFVGTLCEEELSSEAKNAITDAVNKQIRLYKKKREEISRILPQY